MKNSASGERPTILHVVERMGGGLADAVFSYARSDSEFEHHLLYARSSDASFESGDLASFASVTELEKGHIARIRQVRRVASTIGADVLHGHSAFGGVYARLARRRQRTAIAYTPHSFPFERVSAAPISRALYYAVEWLLARNTTVFVACSRREAQLARNLSRTADVAFVANVARVSHNFDQEVAGRDEAPRSLVVVGAGRIMVQKGPSIFAEIAREVRSDERFSDTDFIWIGDGNDDELKRELIDAGVSVTGWLDRREVLDLMSSAALYVHTALWEGFPIVLLESVAVGTPIAVIDRPYAAGLPAEAILPERNPGARIAALLSSSAERAVALTATQRVFMENTAQNQGNQLRDAYRSALSG